MIYEMDLVMNVQIASNSMVFPIGIFVRRKVESRRLHMADSSYVATSVSYSKFAGYDMGNMIQA